MSMKHPTEEYENQFVHSGPQTLCSRRTVVFATRVSAQAGQQAVGLLQGQVRGRVKVFFGEPKV